MRFDGKTALVTGGARGIGAATASRFAAEGASVVIADFDETAAAETAAAIGGRAVRCDVTSRADVDDAVAAAIELGGTIDILVTCAGIIRDNMLFKMSDDDFGAVIDTHLKGSFLAAQASQRHMVEQKSGKIVFISSTWRSAIAGRRTTRRRRPGYRG
jgi:3-oxoacyl-[acyl-carrier protein] reductase